MKADFYANATPFADCDDSITVDPEMPYGFDMRDDGLWYTPPSKDDGAAPFRVCAPIAINNRVRDTQDCYGAIVEYRGTRWPRPASLLSYSLLHKRAGDLAAHLAEAGMQVVTKPYARDALQTFLNEADAPFAVYVQKRLGERQRRQGRLRAAKRRDHRRGWDHHATGSLYGSLSPAGSFKDWQDNIACMPVAMTD